jgi:membrane metallo-endopeptidase-like protein 1
MYVRKYFHVDAKQNALEMVKYIKEQFKDILRSIDWMDEQTRKSALDKANTIVDHIAYPDELLDDRKLGELYDKASLNLLEDMFCHFFTSDRS